MSYYNGGDDEDFWDGMLVLIWLLLVYLAAVNLL